MSESMEERPWDGIFRYFVSMLTQLAQDPRGAKMLLDRGVVEKLGRTRFLAQLEDSDMPSLAPEYRADLMCNLGYVLRLLEVVLSKLALNAELGPQVKEFCRVHARTLMQFIETRQTDLQGLEEIGVVVAVLSQGVGVRGRTSSSSTLGTFGMMGGPSSSAPSMAAPQQDEFRRLVNDLFEKFAVELLPPYATRLPGKQQEFL